MEKKLKLLLLKEKEKRLVVKFNFLFNKVLDKEYLFNLRNLK